MDSWLNNQFREKALTVQNLRDWELEGGYKQDTRVVLICPELKFLHIVNHKVANISLHKAFTSLKQYKWIGVPHDRDLYLEFINTISDEELSQYFVSTFVRNSWDRFVSAYCFFNQTQRHKQWNANSKLWAAGSFEDIVSNREGLLSINYVVALHFRSQFYSTHVDGGRVVDFIGSFENLEQDFEALCIRIGVETPTLRHHNKSARDIDYKKYYNDNTKQVIADWYKEEIEFLRYTF